MYFRNVIEKLPGGISVLCCKSDGSITAEFVSDGLASMLHITVDEMKKLYENNIFAGTYQDDVKKCKEKLRTYDVNRRQQDQTAKTQVGDD